MQSLFPNCLKITAPRNNSRLLKLHWFKITWNEKKSKISLSSTAFSLLVHSSIRIFGFLHQILQLWVPPSYSILFVGSCRTQISLTLFLSAILKKIAYLSILGGQIRSRDLLCARVFSRPAAILKAEKTLGTRLVCSSIRNVKYKMKMFVTAVCFLFLLKLKWSKRKNSWVWEPVQPDEVTFRSSVF